MLMTINGAIERYGEPAQAGLSLEVVPGNVEGMLTIRLVATPAAIEFLGHLVSGFLEEEDCHFSLEPHGAGSAYFPANSSGPGLYLHRQPCHSGTRLFPDERGIGWLCFTASFEDVPVDERDYDPSLIAIEGNTSAFLWLKETLSRAASDGHNLSINAEELQATFGSTAVSAFEINLTKNFAANP